MAPKNIFGSQQKNATQKQDDAKIHIQKPKQKLQSKIRKFVSFEAENIVDFHFEVKNVKQKNVKRTLFGNGTKNETQN